MNSSFKRQLGLAALSLIMFIVTLDTTITNIALPTITNAFNSNLDTSNWVSTVYVLVLSALMIPTAKIGDQLGRKKIIIFGLCLFGIGSLLCSLSVSIIMLIAARALQGIGGAIATPILVPLCVSLVGRKQANAAVGRIGAVAAFAAAVGPCVGGLIIEYWSWRGIFIINVPITVLTVILIGACFKESYDSTISKNIDYFGIILLSTTLFLLTFVLLKGYDYGWLSTRIIFMAISALVLFIVFILIDLRKKYPLIEFSLFRDITFTSSMAIYFACGFTIVCSSVVFNFFLENILGYTALHAGFIIMFSSLMVMLAMPLGNKLGQSSNFRWPLMTGTVLMALGALLLTQLAYNMSLFQMIFAMCVLGLGFGLGSLSLISAVQYIPEEKAGIASGMVNAARQIGTCLGIALLVGLLNNNISEAVNTTKNSALAEIATANLAEHVKTISSQEISRAFKYTGTGKSTPTIDKNKIVTAAKQTSNLPQPKKSTDLYKLYVSEKQIDDGLDKVTIGTSKLQNNLTKAAVGSQQLYSSTMSLSSSLQKVSKLAASQSQTTSESYGISEIVDGSKKVTTGTQQLSEDLIKLNEGALAINDGSKKLKDKHGKLTNGIALIAQKRELNQVLRHIKSQKNTELTAAFNKTFLVSFIFLVLFIPISYWTDKSKIDKKTTGVSYDQFD
ncbi:DHA2 family efflux MFS transporter permease subunit [Levilactobacillus brevis]|uniref:MFS transporter n=1 Tax=Lactobacillaceae TaxID=33958 RepID=UPI000350781E|nr:MULTISPECIES: MFS transporter [Lactobacillaceae]AGO07071.1 drug resistance transport protein, major facilitator subfamily (MFS), EmrB/QacA subfamily [Lactiplantibacillus plantarum 16]MBO2714597.1 DHA2 family efflux MFS transporter permease subunit [Lactiplantibacillus plantarum]MCT3586800.1 DHA2 family efflux MFS transporter permease subunit [Levilactobacillus brevis]